jgi:hypothetical protein
VVRWDFALTVTRVNTRNPLLVLIGVSRNAERGRVEAGGRLDQNLLGADGIISAISRIDFKNELASADVVGDVELNGEGELVA